MSLTLTTPTRLRDASGLRSRSVVAVLLGMLATVVAAAGSWIPSLWSDEVTSIMSAQRTLPSLLTMLQHVDAVHGTYYAGLHLWGAVFGFSPFAVRFPSAIAVGLATAAVVLLADRLRSRRTAVIAGLVCAILPRLTYMGEEARSFAFSAAIAAWLTYLFVVAIGRRGSARTLWTAYGILLAIGVCVFLYVGLFLVVHAAVLLVTKASRPVVRAWAIAAGGGLLLAAPVILFALLEHHQVAYLGASDQLSPPTLFSGLWFGDWPFAVVAWALIVVAVAFAARRRWVGDPSAAESGRVSLTVLAILWLLTPTVILVVMSSVVPDFTGRYVSFCAPAAAILIACGIDDLLALRRWAAAAAGILVLVAVVPTYVSQRTPYAKNDSDFAEIAATIDANANPGDGVVFDESARASRLPRQAMHGYPAAFAGTIDVALQTPYQDDISWHDVTYRLRDAAAQGRFAGIDRVWMIEYVPATGPADMFGVRDLEAIGYHPTGISLRTYRSLITLYER
ncbi:glycosyltransferase family 39 protein [Microbacterium sp. ASV49]|uniref:Glycosyltransferase family 39 protein n=1 Tax=Microbacterium candidum TaxID=3041922 RepID=A0ABT7MWR8_9MICO|nr:glycosyltransferase family 39 protein [Microbacterium sp. ASV49]MDL9978870.1 glycosyltransferase family 39 protein [Microbacterium sp. ASV49]